MVFPKKKKKKKNLRRKKFFCFKKKYAEKFYALRLKMTSELCAKVDSLDSGIL